MERETDDTGILLPVFMEGFANGVLALLAADADASGAEFDADWACQVAEEMHHIMSDKIEQDPITRLKVERLIAAHVRVETAP
jgi:hypothetical protein